MFLGELVRSNAQPVYTALEDRKSNTARFVVDVIGGYIALENPLVVEVEHKNRVDSSWSTAATFGDIYGNGTNAKVATGLKEQVRLKLTLDDSLDVWLRVFIYPPEWQ